MWFSIGVCVCVLTSLSKPQKKMFCVHELFGTRGSRVLHPQNKLKEERKSLPSYSSVLSLGFSIVILGYQVFGLAVQGANDYE